MWRLLIRWGRRRRRRPWKQRVNIFGGSESSAWIKWGTPSWLRVHGEIEDRGRDGYMHRRQIWGRSKVGEHCIYSLDRLLIFSIQHKIKFHSLIISSTKRTPPLPTPYYQSKYMYIYIQSVQCPPPPVKKVFANIIWQELAKFPFNLLQFKNDPCLRMGEVSCKQRGGNLIGWHYQLPHLLSSDRSQTNTFLNTIQNAVTLWYCTHSLWSVLI